MRRSGGKFSLSLWELNPTETRDLNNPERTDQISWSSSAMRQSIAQFVAARQLDGICGRHSGSDWHGDRIVGPCSKPLDWMRSR